MDLINQTPVACGLRVAPIEGSRRRYGLLTAKATFTVDESGRAHLDTQAPYPLFDVDAPTPLGPLPSDAVPRRDHALEVLVLGSVHGLGEPRQIVDLAVGGHRRSLLVTGDRHWLSQDLISEPTPFATLPMSWARAYGGSSECAIDADSIIDLEHPMNKYGLGFDAAKLAADIGVAFKAPASRHGHHGRARRDSDEVGQPLTDPS